MREPDYTIRLYRSNYYYRCTFVVLLSVASFWPRIFDLSNMLETFRHETGCTYKHKHTHIHVVPLDGGAVATTILIHYKYNVIISHHICSRRVSKVGTDQRCTTALRKANFLCLQSCRLLKFRALCCLEPHAVRVILAIAPRHPKTCPLRYARVETSPILLTRSHKKKRQPQKKRTTTTEQQSAHPFI